MRTLLLTLSLTALAAPAAAQLVVIGEGRAQSCYQSALVGDRGTPSAIRTCTEALDDPLTASDKAATYVNRGVLQARRGAYAEANADYERALERNPDLPQIYINQGATLFYLNRDEDALAVLTKALSFETDKRPEALYNRALVYNRMGNAKGAYFDLKEALELKPDWQLARDAIQTYTVTRRPANG